MTVLLVRRMAKELAGIFYEQADSGRPTLSDYMKGYQRCAETFAPMLDAEGKPPFGYFRVEHSERWWKLDRPGWHYFVEQARQTLATMLNNPDVSAHEKHVISEALIEDYNRAADPLKSEKVLQRRRAGKTQIN